MDHVHHYAGPCNLRNPLSIAFGHNLAPKSTDSICSEVHMFRLEAPGPLAQQYILGKTFPVGHCAGPCDLINPLNTATGLTFKPQLY